jgi:flagellar protein FliL
MADGKKDAKKADDAKDGASSADDDAKKKKKKMLMMIGAAVMLVVISIGGTVGALKVLSPSGNSEDSQSEEDASADEESDHSDSESGDDEHADEDSKGHSKKKEAHAETAPAIYYLLKPNFTVNYDVEGKQRFLQTEITLMYRDATLEKLLELHMPAVRNSLVMLLSSQNFVDLHTVEGKENLRATALKAIQEILAKEQLAGEENKDEEKPKDKKKSKGKKSLPTIEQLLFTQFVMQ